MRKSNQQSIGEILQQMLKNGPLGAKLRAADLNTDWSEIAGKIIAKHTRSLRLDEKGILYLEIDSPALRNEVLLMRSELIRNINEHMKKDLVKQITIL